MLNNSDNCNPLNNLFRKCPSLSMSVKHGEEKVFFFCILALTEHSEYHVGFLFSRTKK